MNLGCISYKIPDVAECFCSGPKSYGLYDEFYKIVGYNLKDDLNLVTGLNPGPDVIFAWIAMEKSLPLHVILPWDDYYQKLMDFDKNNISEICSYNLVKVSYSGKPVTPFTYDIEMKKNKIIIDNCDAVLFLVNPGLVEDCVNYAVLKGKEILTLRV